MKIVKYTYIFSSYFLLPLLVQIVFHMLSARGLISVISYQLSVSLAVCAAFGRKASGFKYGILFFCKNSAISIQHSAFRIFVKNKATTKIS